MATVTASPATVVEGDSFGYGTFHWADLNNLKTSNNTYATALATGLWYPYTPICTGFGFAIPAGSSIDKITVKIEAKISTKKISGLDWCALMYNSTPGIMHASCMLSSGDIAPDNPLEETDVIYSINPYYAGDGDKWGHNWTVAEVNDASFGCTFDAYVEDGETLSVDHVQITIDYTEGGATEDVCHSLDCGTGYQSPEDLLMALVSKYAGCAGFKIAPFQKDCSDLTDLVSCGNLISLEDAFKAALTDDGCGGTSLRVWVIQNANR